MKLFPYRNLVNTYVSAVRGPSQINLSVKIDGSDMLLFQALESLDIWFESNISNKLNYSELKKIIC